MFFKIYLEQNQAEGNFYQESDLLEINSSLIIICDTLSSEIARRINEDYLKQENQYDLPADFVFQYQEDLKKSRADKFMNDTYLHYIANVLCAITNEDFTVKFDKIFFTSPLDNCDAMFDLTYKNKTTKLVISRFCICALPYIEATIFTDEGERKISFEHITDLKEYLERDT